MSLFTCVRRNAQAQARLQDVAFLPVLLSSVDSNPQGGAGIGFGYSHPTSCRLTDQTGYRCQAEQHGIHQWRNTSLPCNAKITNNIHLGAAKSSNRAAPAQDSCVLLNLTKFQYLKKSNRVNFASGHPPSSHSELS